MFLKLNFKQLNADAQESAGPEVSGEATTATTNAPVEGTSVAEIPQGGMEVAAPSPHDDFDWSVDKRNVTSYTKDEKEKYEKVYDDTFIQITDGEMIKGLVVACKHF